MLLILWNGLPKVLRQPAIHSSYTNPTHCAAPLLALLSSQFIAKFRTHLFHLFHLLSLLAMTLSLLRQCSGQCLSDLAATSISLSFTIIHCHIHIRPNLCMLTIHTYFIRGISLHIILSWLAFAGTVEHLLAHSAVIFVVSCTACHLNNSISHLIFVNARIL